MRSLTQLSLLLTLGALSLITGCGSGGTTEAAGTAQLGTGGATTPSPTPVPSVPVSTARTATIINSGSTNTKGYTLTITLNADGSVSPSTVPPTLAAQLFADLATANPVSSLTMVPCVKSASFGSTTTVTYNGTTSPDLQCTSGIGTTLNTDVNAIATALNLGGQTNVAVTQ